MTPAGRDAVQFTRESAERIAGVVRTLELTPTRGAALNFDAVPPGASRKVFRVGTYSGAWAVDASKTVTLRGTTATLSAVNPFLNLPSNGTRACGVAKDGTAWYLIQWQQDVTDVVSGASLGASALEFSRVKVASLASSSTTSISVTDCTS
jgi:hypothetical protein